MMYLNDVTLIGRLTKDPDTRMTASGTPIARFSLAVNRIKKKADGTSEADFIRVVCWNRLAEICEKFLKKGRLVSIGGRLQVDTYDYNGEKRTSFEVVADDMQMLERAPDASQPGE
jgi:single-strand DNA-binding protein